MADETGNGRHPFRFMFKFMVFLGILGAAIRFLASKREEYAGLTESEARERMESKLSPRLGEEKASEIADQVVPVLKDRGLLKKAPGEEMMDKAKGAAGDMAHKAKDVAEDVADKTEDIVDKLS
ncbi:MAG: hypothetical protein WD269_04150 [Acidimicrobiia bacterium]